MAKSLLWNSLKKKFSVQSEFILVHSTLQYVLLFVPSPYLRECVSSFFFSLRLQLGQKAATWKPSMTTAPRETRTSARRWPLDLLSQLRKMKTSSDGCTIRSRRHGLPLPLVCKFDLQLQVPVWFLCDGKEFRSEGSPSSVSSPIFKRFLAGTHDNRPVSIPNACMQGRRQRRDIWTVDGDSLALQQQREQMYRVQVPRITIFPLLRTVSECTSRQKWLEL